MPTYRRPQPIQQYSPQDVQQAISHGGQMANQTARTVGQSAGPYVQASGQMLSEQMADKRHKREISQRRREMEMSAMMDGIGMVTDTAFGIVGAVQQGQLLGMAKEKMGAETALAQGQIEDRASALDALEQEEAEDLFERVNRFSERPSTYGGGN